ncbi:MAG: DegT/DnrJ/EryC1/StrS family aminotransferase [Alicyclobacillus herbarius]|uniref:DegT/DnrJ/EryC1/StrS family aminotransferase n=1 Tax=Alicyclobacillus herbarius TaxID=122960 RepID=UPI003B5C7B2E|nr:DegT/DnrJ/EryC1/StrS family aminotransferase [Alicyclobacillus herbarius]
MTVQTPSRIPMFHPGTEWNALSAEVLAAIERVLRDGQFILGPNVRAFEEEVAAYLGVRHAVSVNSGTDALVIALRAAGIGPGDEVITTPFTFFATVEAIHHVGASPVFVDINPDTFNICPEAVESAVTARTKALLVVHLFGRSCAMDGLQRVAESYGLRLVEDCAQAFGATYRGRKVGTMGDAGCFSFFPSKNLGAIGDGGLIATNDDRLAEFARMLRTHGGRDKYRNEMVGYNSRLDEVQAAVLRVKLPYVDAWNERRRQIAQVYNAAFAGLDGVNTPEGAPELEHVYHQYTLRFPAAVRDLVQQRLAELGVESKVYYPIPVHRLPLYGEGQPAQPEAERAAAEVLSLPMWPGLGKEQQERVIQAVSEVYQWAMSRWV